MQQLTTGARVRIINPMAPDFHRAGRVDAVHYAASDSPSYVVRPDGESYCRPYGGGELELLPPPTPAGPDTATTALLASAFKLAHMADAAAVRGADNTVRYLSGAPILDFDASETRALSERKAGTFYVTDGVHCTCPGAPHVWCKHRIAHRLQLAHLALRDPAELIRQIIAQTLPADADLVAMEDAEAVARVEALLRRPEVVPVDPADDDAAYAEALAGINALYA